jgi:hypothetical protein
VILAAMLRQPLPGTHFLTQTNSIEGDTPLTSLDVSSVLCLLFGDKMTMSDRPSMISDGRWQKIHGAIR